jgi:hypothetical protein
MDSSRILVLVLAAWGSPLFAQELAPRGLARPITAPVRYAGVYHLGTGTWTHAGVLDGGGAPPTASTGPGIIYDNTCHFGYYAQMPTGAIFVDEGRLPSTSSVVINNGWGLGHDSEVGTQDTYTIDGFQISYCTSENSSRSYVMGFYEAYDACSPSPATPTASFTLTGLPASSASGALACWVVDIDLSSSSLSFSMQADADQTYDGFTSGVHDTFGWSFELNSPAPLQQDGYLFAGGHLSAGSPYPCSGSDGTVFDSGLQSAIYPANSDAISLGCGSLAAGAFPERGSGMGAQDRYRVENSPPMADGCYWMGTTSGSFYLQLYSANVTLPGTGPAQPFCDPGSGGVPACPCANPPGGADRGCDNSGATGGASLTGSGSASLAADTLVFATAGELPSVTTSLVQGVSTITGVAFGQGVRCVTGTLKRLYSHTASGGGISLPGPGDLPVSARSAALGDPIASGSQRFYFAMYRDPVVLGGCPASRTFNCTNASAVLWN